MVTKGFFGATVLACAPLSILAAGEEDLVPPGAREHWAWKRPVRVEPPAVANPWVKNPIDAFVLRELEEAGLEPADPAPRAVLIRRATLDLTGLPPTPAEIDAFLEDGSPEAFEKVVGRLLASPRHGERWGRHWLDLARYADSNGYEHDEPRPDAWRYRDYVIRSFNADKPYDRFVEEQLAGDLLFPGDRDALVATGFNLLGPDMTDASDQAERRQNTLNDMTDTAGLVLLAMTVGCARCHDHKFEPIPQADYYRLQAFFTPSSFRRDLSIAEAAERSAHQEASKRYEELVRPPRERIAALEEPYRSRLLQTKLAKLSDDAQAAHRAPPGERTAPQKELVEKTTRLIGVSEEEATRAASEADRKLLEELRKEVKSFDSRKPHPLPVATGLLDPAGEAPRTFVLERGQRESPSGEVEPGFPVVLTSALSRGAPAAARPASSAPAASSGRRAALARWISSRDNPLTARVMVNRIWQRHFGRGLVATASDFGLRGELPTHPELLDWLAVEFAASGFSTKAMHRLILMSAAYRQSSRAGSEALRKDPSNRLLSRMSRRRLEGEAIRDGILAASGLLDLQMGGPGVTDPEKARRRSVYLFSRRNLRSPFLEPFDLPDSNQSCPDRERSTTAPQALALLNSKEVAEAARALAARVEAEAGSEADRVAYIYRLTLGRRPSGKEAALALEFLRDSPLSELCRALFNLNEFVYVD